jgi:hypothetical protein
LRKIGGRGSKLDQTLIGFPLHRRI